MRAETLSEQLFFLTCHIRALLNDGTASYGTGFFYSVPTTTAGDVIYVVTNKHVIADAHEVTLTFLRADGDAPLEGHTIDFRVPMTPTSPWFEHSDPQIDITALPVGHALQALDANGTPVMFRSVGPDMSYGSHTANQVGALEDVVFVGYPSGLYDTHNFLPIARQGTTATPITENYQGAPTFLIDAAVFPGSSGSPVCILNEGGYSTAQGFVVGSRILFLGVVARVHHRSVLGEVGVMPTSLVASFNEPIGLGIVFKASTVDELVQDHMASEGLTRATAPVTGDTTPEADGPRP